MIERLVDRFGRTGFAALSSVVWFLPMAAWAGSFDLSPMDKTAYPWIALVIGLCLLVAWIALLTRLGRVTVSSSRPHRLDLARMTGSEKRWSLVLAIFALALVAWLNAAATVDWTPLLAALRQGRPGPILFAAALLAFLLIAVAGVWVSWRRSTAAFRTRAAGAARQS